MSVSCKWQLKIHATNHFNFDIFIIQESDSKYINPNIVTAFLIKYRNKQICVGRLTDTVVRFVNLKVLMNLFYTTKRESTHTQRCSDHYESK